MGQHVSKSEPASALGLEQLTAESRARALPMAWVYRFPWWGLAVGVIGIWVYLAMAADPTYSKIFNDLKEGIAMTLRVSIIAYVAALGIGLLLGMIRSSVPAPKPGLLRGTLSFLHLVAYHAATFFVEVVRGLPILIVLLIAAFVLMPAINRFLEVNYGIERLFRGSSWQTATFGLALTYGAFLSEVFRAGIQSIGKGQIEAARSLGMTYPQTMRLVVLPQAVRRILPPLGNDFIAMIKDSSLVAILGIRDVAQIGKVTSGSNFMYEETYLVVAILYLTMTIIGSLLVRLVESWLHVGDH